MKVAIIPSLLAIALASTTPIVNNCDVEYQGIYRSGIETFLGVPYAQDTGGEHRFKPPRPFIAKSGTVINATAAGPGCPQYELASLDPPLYLSNVTDQSEDCLHLNVYRPNGTYSEDKLPVLVHIHGGSFISSSKDEITIQPSSLVLESIANGHPVIAVNINYRLGIFGFAKSEALRDEGSLNAGLKDQRLALEWIRDNIASFGGDPSKVTIYGQSSGGLAVGMQIMAYGGKKPAPFQQAICQSQALEPGITGDFTTAVMEKLVAASACNTTEIDSNATLSCLRNLTMTELVIWQTEQYSSAPGDNIGDEWLPTVDDDFLPAPPSELIAKGRFNNVTTIMGWCQDDTNPFVDRSISTENDTLTFFSSYLPGMSATHVKDLLSLYPISDFPPNPSANLSSQFYRSGRILRDILMVCEPYYYGAALAKAGNKVYFYDQNQTFLHPAYIATGYPGLGVVHTSEFAYVFGNLSHYDIDDFPYLPNATDYALAKRESRSWSTFAKFGQPSLEGGGMLQGWRPALGREDEVDIMVIGGPYEGLAGEDGEVLGDQKLRERCGFLNRPDIIKEIHF